MATKQAQGTVDIILDANGAPVMAAINAALKRMQDMQRVTSAIADNARKASNEFNKATGTQVKSFEKALSRLEGLEKSLQRLARQPITNAADDKAFAAKVVKVNQFQKGLKDASTAAEAFQGRLNDIDRRLASIGNTGKINGGLVSRRLGLEQAQKDFAQLQREMERMDRFARRSGLNVNRSGYANAESALFGALRQQKTNLSPYLMRLQAEADAYINAIKKEQARVRAAANGGGGPKEPKGPPSLFGATGISGVVARTGAYGAAAAAIYSTINVLKTGFTEAVAFEDQLQKIGAVAGLTQTQIGELGESIKGVAENSRYARQEIAEAATILAQAGFSSGDINYSLQAINNLAAATGSTFAEVTDIMTSAIGAFQLSADEATKIADSLAAALNLTKLNIQQVALGIQYAGATAHENNLTFEDLTATFAALAQAGIRSGSTMGTGVRQFLVDLQTPSKKLNEQLKLLGLTMDDINVKTNGLDGVVRKLSDSGFGAAQAYKGLEVRAAAAYLALRSQQDVALKVAQAQAFMKTSSEGAAKGMDSLAAQWQRFKNVLNNTTTEGVNPAVAALKNLFKAYADAAAEQRENSQFLEYLNEKYKDHSNALVEISREYEFYLQQKEELEQAEDAHAAATERTETAINKATEAFDHEKQVLDSVNEAIIRLAVKKDILSSSSSALAAETLNLEGRFAGLARMLQGTALSYDTLTAAVMRYRQAQLQKVGLEAAGRFSAASAGARQSAVGASRALGQIRSSGLYDRLPADIRKAVDIAQRTKDPTARAQAVIVIQNFAQGVKNPLQRDLLSSYADKAGQLGQRLMVREQSRLDMNTAKLLMGEVGKQLFENVNNANDPASLKSVIGDILNRMEGKGGPAYAALNEILQQASTKLSMIEKPSADAPAASKGGGRRSSDRAEREDDRRMMMIMRERQKADASELALALKNLMRPGGSVGGQGDDIVISKSRTLTEDGLKKNLEKVDKELDDWIKGRLDLMNAEIDAANMEGEQKDLFIQEVMREIQAKREETATSVAENFQKAMDAMIEASDRITEKAVQKADLALAMVEARSTSLDRFGNRGKVPDYVRGYYERQSHFARDKRDQAELVIREQELQRLIKLRDTYLSLSNVIQMFSPEMGAALADLQPWFEQLNLRVDELANSNQVLRASFQNIIPTDFATNLKMMIEQWREVNGMNKTMIQDITEGLSGGLTDAYQSVSTFFNDIISGSKRVDQAFGDMVRSIISALQKMIAEFIAKQFFKLILSFFDPMAGMSLDSYFHGGQVRGNFHGGHIKGAFGGEHIRTGVKGRDSTVRRLSKGEFVMRSAAVDSVGVDFMRRLNEQGAAALRPNAMAPAAPVHQEMAVYVVKEDAKPTMRPKDVLLTVHDDILKDGQTKKLIKLVAQGA